MKFSLTLPIFSHSERLPIFDTFFKARPSLRNSCFHLKKRAKKVATSPGYTVRARGLRPGGRQPARFSKNNKFLITHRRVSLVIREWRKGLVLTSSIGCTGGARRCCVEQARSLSSSSRDRCCTSGYSLQPINAPRYHSPPIITRFHLPTARTRKEGVRSGRRRGG